MARLGWSEAPSGHATGFRLEINVRASDDGVEGSVSELGDESDGTAAGDNGVVAGWRGRRRRQPARAAASATPAGDATTFVDELSNAAFEPSVGVRPDPRDAPSPDVPEGDSVRRRRERPQNADPREEQREAGEPGGLGRAVRFANAAQPARWCSRRRHGRCRLGARFVFQGRLQPTSSIAGTDGPRWSTRRRRRPSRVREAHGHPCRRVPTVIPHPSPECRVALAPIGWLRPASGSALARRKGEKT
jgi:hypothetical protein